MQETTPPPSTDIPVTQTPKTPWYNKRLVVTLWLIFFFPVGLIGLWMSDRFHLFLKIGISALFVLILNIDSQEEKDAKKAGFKSLSDKQAAAQVNITSATSYYQYLDSQEKKRLATIEAEKQEKAREELENEDLSVAAYVICKEYTKQNLASPSSADFPFLPENVRGFKGQSYIIQTYVDSQNKFGAMLRTQVLCKVRYKALSVGGGQTVDIKNWELIELAFN